MHGAIRSYFRGVGFKTLAAVECLAEGISKQQAINVSPDLRSLLGESQRGFTARCIRFEEGAGSGLSLDEVHEVSYGNMRAGKPRRPEYRLGYTKLNEPMMAARAGDSCWVLPLAGDAGTLLWITAQAGCSASRQLDRLLGTTMRHEDLTQRELQLGDLDQSMDTDLTLEDIELLEALGVPVVGTQATLLDAVIERFGAGPKMPPVRGFIDFCREICPTVSPIEEPDLALRDWYTFATEMFYGLEKHVIGPVIDAELANQPTIDLDRFFQLATQYKNSRFSRAGTTFELLLTAIFDAHGVAYQVMARKSLDDGSRPDFLFPSLAHYEDLDALDAGLTFLAAKTTTKERWMQVVAEAPRIQTRHLATLDRDLNSSVLMSMLNKQVVPVIPKPIIDECYPDTSSDEIMSVAEFLDLVKHRERQFWS